LVFEVHYLDLVRVARMWLADVPSSEDAVQDVLVHLSSSDEPLSDVTATYAYVRASVANRARSLVRQRQAQERALGRLDDMTTSAPVVEGASTRGDLDPSLVSQIRHLPPRQRDVVMMRFYLDWSVDQVARELDITRGAVKASTYKALRTLRAHIKETR